jgi:HD domain-containing protein
MLRGTADLPALAPVVAFEHHRRLDGTGYPDIRRTSLNLAATLCSIADVYDAMGVQRVYQQALAAERILAVLKRNDGRHFDPRLVGRFIQLVGVYPVGSLVRTDTGHIGIVRRVHAPDPHWPQIRVVTDEHDPDGASFRFESLGTERPHWLAECGDGACRLGRPRHRPAVGDVAHREPRGSSDPPTRVVSRRWRAEP